MLQTNDYYISDVGLIDNMELILSKEKKQKVLITSIKTGNLYYNNSLIPNSFKM
jgi:hypothetical protein